MVGEEKGGKLTSRSDQVDGHFSSSTFLAVEVAECLPTSHENRHLIVQILFLWQKQTVVANVWHRAALFCNVVPAIATLML
jgi:hypothetical protein